ncbi:sensor histidine kinase [Nocardia brasiliensis]|uniref:sensor histidine kinase n=1 Tax=Nocardia brasiliensis TaxID=37326 RepID=UPI0005A63FFA|nr:HAMP domain-containing sensor histidine kinase [Nocardia brasiliensis]ASF09374.1 sensor histidine kinase [Nocardia brasiliensis]SUB39931.1 Sensor histidine kinase YycG [Nocardia brasiliensis]
MRWPRGLRARLLAAFVLVTVIGAAAAAWAGFASARASLTSDAQNSAAAEVAARITAAAPSLTDPPDQQTLDRLRDLVGGRVWVRYGNLTAATGSDRELVTDELRNAVRDSGGLMLQRISGPRLLIGTPVMVTGVDGRRTRSGIEVYAVRDLSETQARIADSGRAAILTSLLALPLAAGLALLAARGVLRPVRELRDTARRLADGDLTARGNTRGGDELSELTVTVNHMAAQLESTVYRLRASEAESRRFVADVSHELRTPLTTLTAVVEVLEAESDRMTGDQRASALLAVDATRRLTALVADLIEVSRFDAAAERLHPEALEIVAAVRDSLAARLWDDGRVRLRAMEPVEAIVDRRRLDVIVANLVGNALAHGTPPVQVDIRTASEDVLITVDDHGTGLPATDPDRVFTRFYKADAGRGGAGGSGLGLAIAREHARLHGGDITAGRAPTGGARFTVRLPRTPGRPAAGSQP